MACASALVEGTGINCFSHRDNDAGSQSSAPALARENHSRSTLRPPSPIPNSQPGRPSLSQLCSALGFAGPGAGCFTSGCSECWLNDVYFGLSHGNLFVAALWQPPYLAF